MVFKHLTVQCLLVVNIEHYIQFMSFQNNCILSQDSKKISSVVNLPLTAKTNLTSSGKRKPLTATQILCLNDVPLNNKTFQRTASVYYKTASIGNTLILTNEITKDYVKISFSQDAFGYITISFNKNTSFNTVSTGYLCIPKPKFNSDLFKKLKNNKLI